MTGRRRIFRGDRRGVGPKPIATDLELWNMFCRMAKDHEPCWTDRQLEAAFGVKRGYLAGSFQRLINERHIEVEYDLDDYAHRVFVQELGCWTGWSDGRDQPAKAVKLRAV